MITYIMGKKEGELKRNMCLEVRTQNRQEDAVLTGTNSRSGKSLLYGKSQGTIILIKMEV